MSYPMKTSISGIKLIEQFEGIKLKSYLCPAGVPTIGIGHTKGVKMGQTITKDIALQYLAEDIKPIENVLNQYQYKLSQNQYDALVSFLFNVGTGRLTNFHTDLKSQNYTAVAARMNKYIMGGGKVLTGLVNRRKSETELFLA